MVFQDTDIISDDYLRGNSTCASQSIYIVNNSYSLGTDANR